MDDLEVVPHPRKVPVPSSTSRTWKRSPTPKEFFPILTNIDQLLTKHLRIPTKTDLLSEGHVEFLKNKSAKQAYTVSEVTKIYDIDIYNITHIIHIEDNID